MLTKIEIMNINSIKEATFNFSKAKYQYKEEMVHNNEFVNPIAFYGTNGSGKSSFLTALAQMISLLTDEPSELTVFVPHLKNIRDGKKIGFSSSDNSSVKVFFKLDNVNYMYFLETSPRGYISNEKLSKENKVIFTRDKEKYIYQDETFSVSSEMFPVLRTLDLEKNDEIVAKSYNFLSNIGFIDAVKRGYQLKATKQKSYKDIIVENSSKIKEILSKYKEFPLYDIFSQTDELGKKEYYVSINHSKGDLVLPWTFMSDGMRNQSMLISAILTLPQNGVLLVDELEDALHPITIIDFIKVVKEKNIQLIFSSHNTYVLQSLRPDQIFFAHWNEGFSKYKRLSEIYPNIREVNNIEKMYLSNLFDEDIKK